MKLLVKSPAINGIGNINVVKKTGGYVKDGQGSKENKHLSAQTFLTYIKYVKSRDNTENFQYDFNNKYLWEDIGIQQKTFVNKLNELERLGYTRRLFGQRRYVEYEILKADTEVLRIPAGLLLSRRISWDTKVVIVRLLKLTQVTENNILEVSLNSRKVAEPISGVAYKSLQRVVKDLYSIGYVTADPAGYKLDLLHILNQIQHETVVDLNTELKETKTLLQQVLEAGRKRNIDLLKDI